MINVDAKGFQNKGLAIQIIKFDKYKQSFELNPEFLNILQAHDEQGLSFVSISGKYRTGKSFLLNQLLQTQAFMVDESV